jgi:hypothetical protein
VNGDRHLGRPDRDAAGWHTDCNGHFIMLPTSTTPATFDTSMDDAAAMTGSAVVAMLRYLVMSVGLVASAAGLYLLKSALGINLLPWNSPLHDLLYHFVR